MSKNELVKLEIINNPSHYFNAQSKSLEARLDSIIISKEEEDKIASSNVKKFIRDKALGFFKVGEIISEIINWNESVDEDIKEAKKQHLLAQYFDKNDRNEIALTNIKDFLSNAQGNTLFNKILRILDDTPPDLELSHHLSNALRHIVNSDFIALFDEHKYALGQIEQLTPQALTILSDNKSWPSMEMNSYSSNGGKITSDWLDSFSSAYAANKNINDYQVVNRISHSVNELISTRLIEAHLVRERNAQCHVTEIGKALLPYIAS